MREAKMKTMYKKEFEEYVEKLKESYKQTVQFYKTIWVIAGFILFAMFMTEPTAIPSSILIAMPFAWLQYDNLKYEKEKIENTIKYRPTNEEWLRGETTTLVFLN